jgi:hypothetical protein
VIRGERYSPYLCSTSDPAADEGRLHALSDAELLVEVAGLVAERNRVEARLTRVVRIADARPACEHDGLKTMQSWLRGHTGARKQTAAALVHRGRALDLLPVTAAAFTAGAIGAEHVTEIAQITAPKLLAAAAEQGVDVSEVDRALATIAAELDAVGGEKVKAVIEPMAATSRTAGDDRSAAETRGDALVQWADNALAAGNVPVQRTRKSQVAAVIGLDDLVDPATGKDAARLGFGATISAARARWLACDSVVARIVMGPDGAPIHRGREVRIVPAPLRHLLDLRDGGCVFAGCQAPTWWCEAHHLLHWAFGGETDPDNLGLLCERHHGKVHAGFRIDRDPDGTWHTHRPDGTEILLSRDDLLVPA